MPQLGLPGYALACALGRSAGLALHILLWRHRLDLNCVADWWQLRRAEQRRCSIMGFARRGREHLPPRLLHVQRGGRGRWVPGRWPRTYLCLLLHRHHPAQQPGSPALASRSWSVT